MAKQLAYAVLFITIGVAILTAGIMYVTTPIERSDYFTNDPLDWVESEEGNTVVDVYRATRGKSYIEGSQQNYNVEEGITSFYYYGSLNGRNFRTTLVNESLDEMMKISSAMNPTDGIVEGFILGKEIEGGFEFHLFVDEDWKEMVGDTTILVSNDFGIGAEEIPFTYEVQRKGIYTTKIQSDWYNHVPRKGGIIVGDVSLEELAAVMDFELNKTYLMVR